MWTCRRLRTCSCFLSHDSDTCSADLCSLRLKYSLNGWKCLSCHVMSLHPVDLCNVSLLRISIGPILVKLSASRNNKNNGIGHKKVVSNHDEQYRHVLILWDLFTVWSSYIWLFSRSISDVWYYRSYVILSGVVIRIPSENETPITQLLPLHTTAQNEMCPLALSQMAAYIGTSWYRNWKLSDNIGILDIVKN